jgi:hypothetical protein
MPHEWRVLPKRQDRDYAFFRQNFKICSPIFLDLAAFPAPQLGCAICTRRFSGELFENAIELGKRLEPGLERDLADPKIDILQKLARLFEACMSNIIDKIYAGDLLELLAEMILADVDCFPHLAERKLFDAMFLDELSRFPDLGWLGSMA